MNLKSLTIVGVGLLVALGGLAVQHVYADRVFLRNGQTLEGEVIEETRDYIVIERRIGSMSAEQRIARDDIVRIEYEETAQQTFERELAAAGSADACVRIARKAEADGLAASMVREAYERAIELDPYHRGAREALGYEYVDGEWMSAREAKLARGYREYQGELLSPEEIERRKAWEGDAERRRAEESQADYEAELRGVPWGRAHEIEREHYIIKCNSTREVAERYADFMEELYKAYDEIFGDYPRYYEGKSTIYIFRSIQDFQMYGGGRPGVGGFYMPQSPSPNLYPDRIVSAFHGRFGTTGDTRSVLAHEATHQFQHILCDGDAQQFLMRPAWWIEGLAVYFGDGYEYDDRGNIVIGIPRDRLMVLQRYLQSGQVMPISQFIRLPYQRFSMMAGLSYPYSWGLCHYFLHRGEDARGRQQPVEIGGRRIANLEEIFQRFFRFVTQAPPNELRSRGYEEYYAKQFEEMVGVPLDDLMEDFRKYILGLELEPLGEITRDGQRFISEELALEVARPDGWEWRQEEVQGHEAIRLENPRTSGRAIIVAAGNMDNERLEQMMRRVTLDVRDRLRSPFVEDEVRTRINGFDAYEIFYEGEEQQTLDQTRDLQPRQGVQRFRHAVIATLRRTYEVVLQADEDRFEENQAAFDEILASFQILDERD